MRGRFRDRTFFPAAAWALILCPLIGSAQTFQITFDGSPFQPPGSAYLVQSYSEWGMAFTPISPTGVGFARVGMNPVPARPDNGTAYLQSSGGSTLAFGFINGFLLNLASVDLAEYSTVVPDPATVRFVGYRPDGSTVMAEFTTDGIIDGTGPLADFQTFTFGPEFSGLTHVEIPIWSGSLDNLIVSIPEPGIASFLFAAAMAFGFARPVRKRRAQTIRSVTR